MDAEIWRRKRGGQPGNRKHLKHGDYSAVRIAGARKSRNCCVRRATP